MCILYTKSLIDNQKKLMKKKKKIVLDSVLFFSPFWLLFCNPQCIWHSNQTRCAKQFLASKRNACYCQVSSWYIQGRVLQGETLFRFSISSNSDIWRFENLCFTVTLLVKIYPIESTAVPTTDRFLGADDNLANVFFILAL
jgi:hypothetical protein